ncbi:HlyD family secretion protein [Undibacterium sp. MH2W]|uniref:HlyD family secretion protein n=1 Tax=Undibacterium sp. MH2W TaxID=3413044 RepID=UPI003BEFD2B8
MIVLIIAILVALIGVAYLMSTKSSESTDNAYVNADATFVAPKVRGVVSKVYVSDNQFVHAGDALVQIDPEEFNARVATAEADLMDAKANVASAKAALLSLEAEERYAASNVRASQSAIRGAKAQAERASNDYKRFVSLVGSGAVSTRDVDTYHVQAITSEQDVARVSALLDVSQSAESVTRAKRAALDAALQKAEASLLKASANLDLAKQDQQHTIIHAPVDGFIGNRQVQQGDYVQAGSRLLSLVNLKACYVVANFKETQIDRIRPGQPVVIELDAIKGKAFSGTVDSIAPGSGSQFSLLPFEPGTGNFTKIVQRVPVRIRLNPKQEHLEEIRPGLSATTKVTLN